MQELQVYELQMQVLLIEEDGGIVDVGIIDVGIVVGIADIGIIHVG